MKNETQRKVVQSMKSSGSTYNEIADILGITKDSVRNLYRYKCKAITKKRGPKVKLNSSLQLRFKREISNLKKRGEKVNSPKLIRNCNINCSNSTCHRYLKSLDYKYKKVKSRIVLSPKHKLERIRIISDWISTNLSWESTIFSDEKRFSLDGPDDWRTYIHNSENYFRQTRQCKGGGVMVWLMVMPNGLLTYHIIEGKFNSAKYVDLLNKVVVPIMKLNFNGQIIFQEDNCRVHKARIVNDFWKNTGIRVLEWPSKSPDLNITEDIWKVISDSIYDGRQFNNTSELTAAIQKCIYTINCSNKEVIKHLYQGMRARLCKVLCKKGDLYNK